MFRLVQFSYSYAIIQVVILSVQIVKMLTLKFRENIHRRQDQHSILVCGNEEKACKKHCKVLCLLCVLDVHIIDKLSAVGSIKIKIASVFTSR